MAGARRGKHHDRPRHHPNLIVCSVKLVLFDIDGTILWSDGAGRRAMQRALMAAFGTSGNADYRYDGKTDMQIVRDLMRMEGHDDAVIDERMDVLLSDYVAALHEELRS